jgi:peroxiredoxin Q/BCP
MLFIGNSREYKQSGGRMRTARRAALKTVGVTLVVLGLVAPTPAAMLKDGEPFPAWELVDQTGTLVSSRDLGGKTYLVWFYPKAMTPGCTAEGRGLRDQHAAYEARGVTVFGVSFDEPKANAEFVRQEQFPFRLLSDRDRNFAIAVGAADSPEQAVARRISYLVGPDGKVMKAYATVNTTSHATDVLKDVAPAP